MCDAAAAKAHSAGIAMTAPITEKNRRLPALGCASGVKPENQSQASRPLMTKMGNAVTTNTKATRQELPFVSSRALLHVAPGASIAMAGNRMARRTTMMTTVMARTKAGMPTTPARPLSAGIKLWIVVGISQRILTKAVPVRFESVGFPKAYG
jgi:hypothetical protein